MTLDTSENGCYFHSTPWRLPRGKRPNFTGLQAWAMFSAPDNGKGSNVLNSTPVGLTFSLMLFIRKAKVTKPPWGQAPSDQTKQHKVFLWVLSYFFPRSGNHLRFILWTTHLVLIWFVRLPKISSEPCRYVSLFREDMGSCSLHQSEPD